MQDIAWAPDASALATCSIDHNTVLWSAAGGPGVARLQDHRHYVQGAAWDPAAQFLVTQSSDRTCRRVLSDPSTVSVLSASLKVAAAFMSDDTSLQGSFITCAHVLSGISAHATSNGDTRISDRCNHPQGLRPETTTGRKEGPQDGSLERMRSRSKGPNRTQDALQTAPRKLICGRCSALGSCTAFLAWFIPWRVCGEPKPELPSQINKPHHRS